ncbi:MAG TPA: NAD(P)-binding domain-containing protein [Candidatus Solibacter sp.]|jgi:thioredoxin reductase|nr:NAD(P)-binding domain-containing protein [Candidatus Solibacter sp.]
MEDLAAKPFPPGAYPLVIVGSGPGALQLSYSLRRLGVQHAVISADEGPGGMFRKWPLFQRMLSWSKPFAPADRRSRQYERYDWNSLLGEEEELRGVQAEFMDGTSYFPSRQEMEQGLTAFAQRAGIEVRYGCRWESTRHTGDGFVLTTSDGDYTAPIAVFAVGVAEPWRPGSPGLDQVPHYAQMSDAADYAGKSVFIVGKKNSAFEIATGLLPWATRIVLASPSPAKTSVETRSLVGVRARYVQPFEDHALGGGVFIVDAAIDSITRSDSGYQVAARFTAGGGEHVFQADEVIAATGFQTPLQDLSRIGVSTFGQSGLPAQTAYWESASVPGIYFAGTITQGAAGLQKHGVPANSGAVHGHRYNARVLAEHIARKHFNIGIEHPVLSPDLVVDAVLDELTGAPGRGGDIFHQRSYLVRVMSLNPSGVIDEGIQPLSHFLDVEGPDAVAVTLEANAAGQIYPALYLRQKGVISERLLDPHPLMDFRTPDHRRAAEAALEPVLRVGVG